MERILTWNSCDKVRWAYGRRKKESTYFVYQLTRLPDFSAPRFQYLCKEADQRTAEVAKKQQQMLRQFHGLGEEWAVSLRILKKETLTLYLIFRCAESAVLSEQERQAAEHKIQNA